MLISSRWPTAKLGAFQVKYHFSETADLTLIQQSAAALHSWATVHPDTDIHLNMPGVGNGHLSRNAVLPLIQHLPNNITIWEYAHQLPT